MSQLNSKNIEINGRKIGIEFDPYIVAEMSGNHNGEIENAFKIIEKAKESGADAVKLQTYTADTITINHDSPEFLINGGLWDGRKLYELYEEAHTPWSWHKQLFDYAERIGITIFSSPFDATAVDFLENLNVKAYKIASPEIIDLSLISKIAKTGKPIILSTGMATEFEIKDALDTIHEEGNEKIIVLHCTSAYPTPISESNLITIKEISSKFNVLPGLSDHSLGTEIAKLSTMLGATFIEKHFTLSRKNGGVDSQFSIEPSELKELVEFTKNTKKIFGKVAFKPTKSEENSYKVRRSLYVVEDIKKGCKFSNLNIKSIRPGNGLKPKYINKVLGCTAKRDIKFGEPLNLDMILEKL